MASRNIDANLGDLDRDGRLDLVVASREDQTITWHQNLGAGLFSEPRVLAPTAGAVRQVFVSDVDSDGDQDIVTATDHELLWYENQDGRANFLVPRQIATFQGPFAHVLATDLDGDGDSDFVAIDLQANASIAVMTFHNAGTAPFTTRTVDTRPNLGIPQAADVDHDGDRDLLIWDAKLFGDDTYFKPSWYENLDSRGTFSALKTISSFTPSPYNRFLPVDLDTGGRIDLITQRLDGELEWAEQLTNGPTFMDLRSLSVTTSFFNEGTWATTDWNQDGILDLITTEGPSNGLQWLPSAANGALPFSSARLIDSSEIFTVKLLAGDLNGDLRDELVAVGDLEIRSYEYISAEDRFVMQPIAPKKPAITDAKIVDLDRDGLDDVIVSRSPDVLGFRIEYYRNERGTGFSAPTVLTSVELESLIQFELADLNGDGRLDLLSTFGSHLDWQSQAENSIGFGDRQPLLRDRPIREMEVVDLDQDSDLDLVILEDRSLFWLENSDGRGTFALHTISNAVRMLDPSLAVGDLNGDAHPDVVVPSEVYGIEWYQHIDGNGRFEARGAVGDLQGRGAFRNLELHDLNSDGRLDLTARANQGEELGWLENSVLGLRPYRTLDDQLELDILDFDAHLFDDFDDDSDLDVLVSVPDTPMALPRRLALYENLGNGQFRPASLAWNWDTSSHMTLAAGDLDGDQRTDFLVGTNDGQLTAMNARTIGDVNRDHIFNSSDLVALFQIGGYEDELVGNADFYSGDWNGDGEFDSSDLILAMQSGQYRS